MLVSSKHGNARKQSTLTMLCQEYNTPSGQICKKPYKARVRAS